MDYDLEKYLNELIETVKKEKKVALEKQFDSDRKDSSVNTPYQEVDKTDLSTNVPFSYEEKTNRSVEIFHSNEERRGKELFHRTGEEERTGNEISIPPIDEGRRKSGLEIYYNEPLDLKIEGKLDIPVFTSAIGGMEITIADDYVSEKIGNEIITSFKEKADKTSFINIVQENEIRSNGLFDNILKEKEFSDSLRGDVPSVTAMSDTLTVNSSIKMYMPHYQFTEAVPFNKYVPRNADPNRRGRGFEQEGFESSKVSGGIITGGGDILNYTGKILEPFYKSAKYSGEDVSGFNYLDNKYIDAMNIVDFKFVSRYFNINDKNIENIFASGYAGLMGRAPKFTLAETLKVTGNIVDNFNNWATADGINDIVNSAIQSIDIGETLLKPLFSKKPPLYNYNKGRVDLYVKDEYTDYDRVKDYSKKWEKELSIDDSETVSRERALWSSVTTEHMGITSGKEKDTDRKPSSLDTSKYMDKIDEEILRQIIPLKDLEEKYNSRFVSYDGISGDVTSIISKVTKEDDLFKKSEEKLLTETKIDFEKEVNDGFYDISIPFSIEGDIKDYFDVTDPIRSMVLKEEDVGRLDFDYNRDLVSVSKPTVFSIANRRVDAEQYKFNQENNQEGVVDLGYIYVMPAFSEILVDNSSFYKIPIQNNIRVNGDSLRAEYNKIDFLNRIGSVTQFVRTESRTIEITTQYRVTDSDDSRYGIKELQKIEYMYKSLLLPQMRETNKTREDGVKEVEKYLTRPPLINIVYGETPNDDAVANVFENESNIIAGNMINNFFTNVKWNKTGNSIDNTGKLFYRSFVVTDLSIEKDYEEIPYYMQEISGKFYPKDFMGFDISMTILEVDPNFLGTNPTLNDYYNFTHAKR